MSIININARLQQKHDIAANWEKSNIIPLAGEIIVYDDRYIDSNNLVKIVATAVRYKIGDGVTSVNKLPFADVFEVAAIVKELTERIGTLESNSLNNLTPIDGSILIKNTDNGEKAIGVAIAPVEGNALTAVDGGLFVPTATQYTAGNGIKITDDKIEVKLTDTTRGLSVVNGALNLNVATKNSDGVMSKEDKRILDSIPSIYEARKYEIFNTPAGTLVDYGNYEIRVMCPKDAVFKQQAVGNNGNPNMYYMTFKAYAPENAVSFKEGDRGIIIDEMHTFDGPASGIDEFGRKYSVCWLALASYDQSNDTWTYFGNNSNENKYIGWDYCVEWYDENGDKINYDSVRINLSNESCHTVNKPYYMANYATSKEVDTLSQSVSKMEQTYTWGEM